MGWSGLTGSPGTRTSESPADVSSDSDDRALVEAFRSGRREAFDEIVRRYRRPLFQICYRFTGNHEDAADLTQDAFVRAFTGLSGFRHDAALSTWLYRIAVNACLNRSAARRPDTEPVDRVERADDRAPTPLETAERGETRAAVHRAIRRLPPRQRATVILRVYHELSHEQIARVLGTTIGASKTNFFHALAKLRRVLTP